MDFIDFKIEDYCLSHSDKESELLYNLTRETNLKVLRPRMLSGHLQGRLLSFISSILRPSYIVEVGTYTSYSTICLAEGLTKDGKLITIDSNKEIETIVKKYLKLANLNNVVDFILGDACNELPKLDSGIDLVFLDADKENYSKYFDILLPKLKSKGVIIADNVLWSGKVIQDIGINDKDTKAIVEFNEKINQCNEVNKIMLPIRDGLYLIQKK